MRPRRCLAGPADRSGSALRAGTCNWSTAGRPNWRRCAGLSPGAPSPKTQGAWERLVHPEDRAEAVLGSEQPSSCTERMEIGVIGRMGASTGWTGAGRCSKTRGARGASARRQHQRDGAGTNPTDIAAKPGELRLLATRCPRSSPLHRHWTALPVRKPPVRGMVWPPAQRDVGQARERCAWPGGHGPPLALYGTGLGG